VGRRRVVVGGKKNAESVPAHIIAAIVEATPSLNPL